MKQTRRLNPLWALLILSVTIVLVATATGFKIASASPSAPLSIIAGAQVPTAAPGSATAASITPSGNLLPVSWKDLVAFLEKDHTNWNKYVPGKYMCLDFSTDLVANATGQGIEAWIVAVDFTSGGPGHAFVAFQTTDRGIVFVEPQADDTYPVVKVGQPLCDAWGVYQCMGKVSSIEYLQCDKAHDCVKYTP